MYDSEARALKKEKRVIERVERARVRFLGNTRVDHENCL
jgi:hypothetical protein